MSLAALPSCRLAAIALAGAISVCGVLGAGIADADAQAPPPPPPSGGAPSPGSTPSPPPALTRPSKAVELVAARVRLEGRRLAVPIHCRESGSAALRRNGRTIARTRFRCAGYSGVASFVLPRPDARALHRSGRARVAVHFAAAGERSQSRVLVTAGGSAQAKASAVCNTDSVGVVKCYTFLGRSAVISHGGWWWYFDYYRAASLWGVIWHEKWWHYWDGSRWVFHSVVRV